VIAKDHESNRREEAGWNYASLFPPAKILRFENKRRKQHASDRVEES
jgi:hypothetical protein